MGERRASEYGRQRRENEGGREGRVEPGERLEGGTEGGRGRCSVAKRRGSSDTAHILLGSSHGA